MSQSAENRLRRPAPLVLVLVLVAVGLITPAAADEGGGSFGTTSRSFNCKMPARDVDPALLLLDLPGDADQMDGCGFGVATGKKGVKVDLVVLIRDDDGDSDSDSDSDHRRKRCRGRTDSSGQFFCTMSQEDFRKLGLNEALDSAQVEALLNGGKKVVRFDLFSSCSAGSSTSP